MADYKALVDAVYETHDYLDHGWGPDPNTGQMELQGKLDELITADVASTRNIVITSAADRVVRVWDMDGSLLAKIDHVEPVRAVCVSRDGMRVLTASEDGCARLWDLNGKVLFVFSDAAALKQAVFSADGHHVVTASAHSVSLWDFGSPESIIARYGKTVSKFPDDETSKEGS